MIKFGYAWVLTLEVQEIKRLTGPAEYPSTLHLLSRSN